MIRMPPGRFRRTDFLRRTMSARVPAMKAPAERFANAFNRGITLAGFFAVIGALRQTPATKALLTGSLNAAPSETSSIAGFATVKVLETKLDEARANLT